VIRESRERRACSDRPDRQSAMNTPCVTFAIRNACGAASAPARGRWRTSIRSRRSAGSESGAITIDERIRPDQHPDLERSGVAPTCQPVARSCVESPRHRSRRAHDRARQNRQLRPTLCDTPTKFRKSATASNTITVTPTRIVRCADIPVGNRRLPSRKKQINAKGSPAPRSAQHSPQPEADGDITGTQSATAVKTRRAIGLYPRERSRPLASTARREAVSDRRCDPRPQLPGVTTRR